MRIAWRPLLHALPLVLWAPGAAWAGPAMARDWPSSSVLSPVAINTAAEASDLELRVLVQQTSELVVEANAQPLQLRTADGVRLAALAPGQFLRLSLDPASPAGLLLTPPEIQPDADGALTPVSELWLEPAGSDGLIGLKQRTYRGRLQVLRQGNALLAINHVGLESYLPSVVGSEMPPSWPQSALRAQAVAARTYALRQRRRSEPFDLQATVASQVYKGVGSETPSTREAVAATRGQVLLYQGALIEAVFHSSSGGSTEASGDLWAQQLPYLVRVPDFDDHSPVRRWQERFEAQQLRQLFADIGGVQAITVSDRSAGGRVRRIRVEGPRGALSLTGAELRRRLGLRSTWIEVELIQPFALARPAADATQDHGSQAMPAQGQASQEPDAGAQAAGQQPSVPPPPPPPPLPGAPASLSQAPLAGLLIRGRGFGHGVGMSQWGAHGLAQRGASHAAILSHYYPGTQLNAYRDP